MSLCRSIADQMRRRAFLFPSTPPPFFQTRASAGPCRATLDRRTHSKRKENKVSAQIMSVPLTTCPDTYASNRPEVASVNTLSLATVG